ncbi:hypothetical protein [Aquimarina sp. 2201CG5-10]|uniref:hypothetical protein n=1 Tax=Aquimarina callyspongiae TaxID=3098150 RepID=UPI002AB389F6|nr:hypothetical protein [Aquimarina sp. 2201CG5-10]MDY8134393.1 hypothetical protein [Aquimarina sp. 2201CG5-10]
MKKFLLVFFLLILCNQIAFGNEYEYRIHISEDFDSFNDVTSNLKIKDLDILNRAFDYLVCSDDIETNHYPKNYKFDKTTYSTGTVTITYPNSVGSSSIFCESDNSVVPVIITGTAGGTFVSTPVGLSLQADGSINIAASNVGTYTVTYTTPDASCTDDYTVEITNTVDAGFSYESVNYCTGGQNPLPIYNQPLFPNVAGAIFQSSTLGGSMLDPVTGEINLATAPIGEHTVRRFIFGGGCNAAGTAQAQFTIFVVNTGDPSFVYPAISFCKTDANPSATITGTAGGTFSSTNTNLVFADINTGEVDLTTTPPGTYPIVYTLTGNCAAASAPLNITVLNVDATFSYASDYCSSDSDPTANITGITGGTFTNSSTSGLIFLNTTTGLIDLGGSTSGNHEITYTVTSGGCTVFTTTTINITQNSTADFNYTQASYCIADSDPSPNITGDGGGTFSSASGLIFNDSNTGEIDLSASTPGLYTITYTIAGSCGITVQKNLTINAENPTLSFEVSIDDAAFVARPTADISIEIGRKLELRMPESFNGTISWSGPNSFSASGTEVEVSDDIQMVNSGVYTAAVTFDVTCGAAPTSYDFTVNVINNVVRVSPKVYLQGAMLGTTDDMMRDNLRTLSYLPNDTPYTDGVSVDGTIFNDAALDQDNIVDWVYVELRDATTNTTVIDGQSAFVQRDGDVVDINGNSEITLAATTGGDYFVVIKHRNHLSIMTDTAITLTTTTTTLDFRDGTQATFGGVDAQTVFGMPVNTVGMWAGDVNGDGVVLLFGSGNDSISIGDEILADPGNGFNSLLFSPNGYNNSDLFLDGTSALFGSGNDTLLIGDNILANPANGFNSLLSNVTTFLP